MNDLSKILVISVNLYVVIIDESDLYLIKVPSCVKAIDVQSP